jgi:hypothetical protein
VQKGHSARDMGVRDAVMKDHQLNRGGGGIRPGINLREEPGKDGHSEGENYCTSKAPVEPGTETSEEQLQRGSERTTSKFHRKALRLEFVKQATGMSIGLQKMRNWTLWRGCHLQSGKRGCTRSNSRICGSTGHSGGYGPP